MITARLIGVTELVNALSDANVLIDPNKVSSIIHDAAVPIQKKIQDNYKAAGHYKTGSLVDSISIFRGTKRSRVYDSMTYYVGPRYSTKNSLSAGGNAAHLLEWGTKIRHKADINKGGYAGKGTGRNRKTIYGAKIKLGSVKGVGVLRRSYDEMKGKTLDLMAKELNQLIVETAKQNGFEVK